MKMLNKTSDRRTTGKVSIQYLSYIFISTGIEQCRDISFYLVFFHFNVTEGSRDNPKVNSPSNGCCFLPIWEYKFKYKMVFNQVLQKICKGLRYFNSYTSKEGFTSNKCCTNQPGYSSFTFSYFYIKQNRRLTQIRRNRFYFCL